MDTTKNILLIMEDPEILRSLHGILDGKGYAPIYISNLEDASTRVNEWVDQFDLVVIEDNHEADAGVNLMLKAHSLRRALPVVIVSREEDPDGYVSIMKMGADYYSVYPFDTDRLARVFDWILSVERVRSPSRSRS